jgi:cytochrome P450
MIDTKSLPLNEQVESHDTTDDTITPVPLKAGVAFDAAIHGIKGFAKGGSFIGEFLAHAKQAQGEAFWFHLWPVFPPIYVLMGKAGNRAVFSEFDASLKQMLQVIFGSVLKLVGASIKVPTEEDAALQKKVQLFFQSTRVINERLPLFHRIAEQIRSRWCGTAGHDASSRDGGGTQSITTLEVFEELSEYVLRTDLDFLYGKRFAESHSSELIVLFNNWVREPTASKFFDVLGERIKEAIPERQANPEMYEGESSVLRLYLESDALKQHDLDEVAGLLVMSIMAAAINTQVSLAWILNHLYSDPELLSRAREEIASCSRVDDYATLERLDFLNACIDESVRLHATVPGKLVAREAECDLEMGGATIKKGSRIWLYPASVHNDEKYYQDAQKFCPYRLLSGKRKRMINEFELVTFGTGRKRCIGEKMARAMILSFLVTTLPRMDADVIDELPGDDFNDLKPVKKLRLHNLREHNPEAELLSRSSAHHK